METEGIKQLPPILVYPNDWEAYEASLYDIFLNTLINNQPSFQGLLVSIRRSPEYKEKHFAFWHLISEGEKEEERTPDFRRCERLAWVAWIIENGEKHPEISFWENIRGSSTHVVIWHERENFTVVLAKRNGYFLLKTAYVPDEGRVKDFIKERAEYYKKKS